MHKDFFSHLIRDKPELFQAILAFNGLDDGRNAPPPRILTDIPGLDASAIWNNPRARKHFATAPDGFWDFTEESRRLALIEPAVLARTARLFGAAIHARELARLIRREEVLDARRILGTELITYALERGRFQLGSLTEVFAHGHEDMPLPQRILAHGRMALESCWVQWPQALLRLWHPDQIPHDTDRDADFPGLDDPLLTTPELGRRIWFGFKKILLREVAPQWAPCFD